LSQTFPYEVRLTESASVVEPIFYKFFYCRKHLILKDIQPKLYVVFALHLLRKLDFFPFMTYYTLNANTIRCCFIWTHVESIESFEALSYEWLHCLKFASFGKNLQELVVRNKIKPREKLSF
jgi:hypothetical protein